MAAADPFSVDTYLSGLSEEHRRLLMRAFMQYPRTETLDASNSPICECTYTCDWPMCNFAAANTCVKEDAELRAYGATTFLLDCIDQFERHPDDFLPHRFDGFQFHHGGFDLLRLQRVSGDDTEVPGVTTTGARSGGRTGVVECKDVRDKAMSSSTAEEKRKEEATTACAVM